MEEKDRIVGIEDLFTQKVLKNCFEEVLREVLPKGALTYQTNYMQNTSKRKKLSVKKWLRRLEFMRDNLKWLSLGRNKMDNVTFSQRCIKNKILQE